jgi:hypothetical protein
MKMLTVENIRSLARAWKDIASDAEAAPTGTMLRAINVLLKRETSYRKLLREIRPHMDALAVTDDDPTYRNLLHRIDRCLQ